MKARSKDALTWEDFRCPICKNLQPTIEETLRCSANCQIRQRKVKRADAEAERVMGGKG